MDKFLSVADDPLFKPDPLPSDIDPESRLGKLWLEAAARTLAYAAPIYDHREASYIDENGWLVARKPDGSIRVINKNPR